MTRCSVSESDGFDRLKKTLYPHKTSVGTSSATDYEELSWSDAGATRGLLAGRVLRDGTSYAYEYDALGRMTLSDAPAGTADVAYEYDLFGRLVEASGGGGTLGYAYDALGRLLSETQGLGTVSYQYNPAGRRTRAFYPGAGSFSLAYVYDWAGGLTKICVKSTITNCKTETAPALGFSYDDLGRRVSVMRGNGVETAYGYDGASRLASLAHDPAGAGDDQSWEFDRNPAGQIVAQTAALSGWGWTMGSDYSEAYTANGLNQHLTVAGASVSHDARGNMTSDGLGRTFGYDAANRLTSVSGGASATLAYDPAGRLREVAGTATTRFLYDGADVIAEYDDTDALLRRYVHGPGLDEPLIWYEGTGTANRRFLLADPRGSVVAVTDGAGDVTDVNKYDDYGAPASGNLGRFQFTGQMWLEEAGLYHFKARAYHPALGRFMQTDPIGYGDGLNMYAYVGNDPVNRRDPSGMVEDEIIVEGNLTSLEGSSAVFYGFDALSNLTSISKGVYYGGIGGFFLPRRDAPKPKSNNGVEEIVVNGVWRRWETIPTLVAGFSALNFLKLHASASGQGNSGSGDGEEDECNERNETAEHIGELLGLLGGAAICRGASAELMAGCALLGSRVGEKAAAATATAYCKDRRSREELQRQLAAKGCRLDTTPDAKSGAIYWKCPDGTRVRDPSPGAR